MAIPGNESLIWELLNLLVNHPAGEMHCSDVYNKLANDTATDARGKELAIPTQQSHWANRVQWAHPNVWKRATSAKHQHGCMVSGAYTATGRHF